MRFSGSRFTFVKKKMAAITGTVPLLPSGIRSLKSFEADSLAIFRVLTSEQDSFSL